MFNSLIIFTRYPEPGKAKTRLIPALGAAGAAELHRQMTESTIAKARSLPNIEIAVYFTGGSLAQMQHWLGHDLAYRLQHSGDLGDRLIAAFQTEFDRGAQFVVAIGTDCPDLTSEILASAFEQLTTHPVAIGAATDGGYYLIGLNQPISDIFCNITWSTSVVFEQTLKIAERLNLTIAYLPTLMDIDRPEDLNQAWKKSRS